MPPRQWEDYTLLGIILAFQLFTGGQWAFQLSLVGVSLVTGGFYGFVQM
jgi:hypothetical protein